MSNRRTFPVKTGLTQVKLLLGLFGYSGAGKTFSALEIATGIARFCGGPIVGIDTEYERMGMYAQRFNFQRIDFTPPYNPLSYVDALEQALTLKPSVVVLDSMSHEHDGEGGVLDMHNRIAEEMAERSNNRNATAQTYNYPAWAKPKAERTRLIQVLQRYPAHVIMCFRAKDKSRPNKDKNAKWDEKILDLGVQPLGAEELFYELTLSFLLQSGSGGVPTLKSENPFEQRAIKSMSVTQEIVGRHAGKPLSQQLGYDLAAWAKGGTMPTAQGSPPVQQQQRQQQQPPAQQQPKSSNDDRIAGAKTLGELADVWKSLTADEKRRLERAKEDRKAVLEFESEQASRPPQDEDNGSEVPANGSLFGEQPNYGAIQ